MERELILTVKGANDEIEHEIELLKTMFPYFESFEAFRTANQVMDLKKHKSIVASMKLRNIFNKGITESDHHFIISLN